MSSIDANLDDRTREVKHPIVTMQVDDWAEMRKDRTAGDMGLVILLQMNKPITEADSTHHSRGRSFRPMFLPLVFRQMHRS
jgi:hypothetical protein